MKKKPIYQELEIENDILRKKVEGFENNLKRSINENENKYKSIFKNSPIGIAIFDINGNPINVNKTMLQILGSPSEETIQQINILSYQPLVKVGFSSDFTDCISSGNTIIKEKIYTTRWNKKIYMRYFLTPIYDEIGNIKSVQCLFENINERKIAEIELKNKNEELKKAKERVEVSEKKFRELFEKFGDAILIIENEAFIDCNQETVKMLKYSSKEEFLDVHPSKLSPETQPDGRKSVEKADEMMETALINGTHRFEWDHMKSNGEVFPVEVLLTTISNDPDKRVIHTVWRDITKRKMTEKKQTVLYKISKFANESNHLRTFLEKVHLELSSLINTDNFYVALYHAEPDKYSFVYHVDKYDDFENPEQLIEIKHSLTDYIRRNAKSILIDEKLNSELTKAGEIKLIGEPSAIWLGAPLIDSKGNSIGVIAVQDYESATAYTNSDLELLDFVARNIGSLIEKINFELSLKKSLKNLKIAKEKAEENEQRLKTLINASPDAIFFKDGNGKWIEVNKSGLELFDLTNTDYKGKTDRELANNADFYKDAFLVCEKTDEIAWQKKSISNEEEIIPVPDGSYKTYDVIKVPLFNEDNSRKGIVVIGRNITKRKKTEHELKKQNEELIKAKEKAEESDRFKSAFLANMSHEIRTPMNGIVGFSELLQERDLSETKRKQFIDIINKNCQQLLGIVNDIIDMSKIETGQIYIKNEETGINDLVEELFTIYSHIAEKNDLKLNIHKSLPDQQVIILTDKIKLRQIIDNLLGNAIKFTHKGHVGFGYKLINNNIEFYIEDTGIGISKKEQEIIFGRFNQATLDIAQNYGGTGLGLSIAKAYVELLGGKIWLESEEGKGSVFYFTIPYVPALKNKNEKVRVINNDDGNKQISVLVVEDDEINFLLIKEILSKMNIEVIHAATGAEAIEICKNNTRINLVLMDIKLPDVSGLEVTKKLKLIRKNIPIIAQTAYALEGDKEKALSAGCIDYIPKPIVCDELIRMVKQYALKGS